MRAARASDMAISRHCGARGANAVVTSAPTVKTMTIDWVIR